MKFDRVLSLTVFRGVIICILLLSLNVSAKAMVNVHSEEVDKIPEYINMPWEYGEVIYRINPESSKQLFIIGIGHRNPKSGLGNSTILQTQIDIFHIGVWLNRKLHLNLLLPEGYFNGKANRETSFQRTAKENVTPSIRIPDNTELEEWLSQENTFINAEMLLMKYIPYHASQVENRKDYNAVRQSLDKVSDAAARHIHAPESLAELSYRQKLRTARLLQRIPSVINTAFEDGTTRRQTALFTIGLNHIKDISSYIQNKTIRITAPNTLNASAGSFESSVDLLDRGYGVTIILPRTLADNHKLLEFTNIDTILLTGDS